MQEWLTLLHASVRPWPVGLEAQTTDASGIEKQQSFECKDDHISSACARRDEAEEIDENRADETAHSKGDRLRGTPDAHSDADAPDAALGCKLHHVADGCGSEHAVGDAEQDDYGLERKWRSNEAGRSKSGKRQRGGDATADDPTLERPKAQSARAEDRDSDHARKNARMLHPGELRRLTGREVEDEAAKRFEYEILHAVGQHGHEHEECERTRLRFPPHVAKCGEEIRLWVFALVLLGAQLCILRLLDAPKAKALTMTATIETTPQTAMRRMGEKGSRNEPPTPVVTMKPTIIMSQTIVAAAARRCG